jgi:hypothetical protein
MVRQAHHDDIGDRDKGQSELVEDLCAKATANGSTGSMTTTTTLNRKTHLALGETAGISCYNILNVIITWVRRKVIF